MNTANFKVTSRYRKLKHGDTVRRITGCGKSLREQQNLEYMLKKKTQAKKIIIIRQAKIDNHNKLVVSISMVRLFSPHTSAPSQR